MASPDPAADTHVTDALFDLAFEDVWPHLSDPLGFPALFPNWTAAVDRSKDGTYRATGPDGDEFTIEPLTDRETGVLDFQVETADGAVERSRSRLFSIDESRCQWIHLAVRWPGMDDEGWADHVRGTDADFANARPVLEADLG